MYECICYCTVTYACMYVCMYVCMYQARQKKFPSAAAIIILHIRASQPCFDDIICCNQNMADFYRTV